MAASPVLIVSRELPDLVPSPGGRADLEKLRISSWQFANPDFRGRANLTNDLPGVRNGGLMVERGLRAQEAHIGHRIGGIRLLREGLGTEAYPGYGAVERDPTVTD